MMDWFKDLYDNFRMKRTFGSISDERTKQDVDFIINVLDLPEGGKVLDLFSGIGRHSIELAKRGYKPIGIEYNQEYLNIAQSRALENNATVEFIHGDVREVNYGSDFDAAIIMYQSFGYFSDEDDKNVLSKIYYALRKNGRFLIEILNRNWLLKNFVAQEESMFNDVKIREERNFDHKTNRVNFVIRRYKDNDIEVKKGSWKIYSADEMTHICNTIGFKFVAGYNDLDESPLQKNTRLMRLVFKK